MDNINLDKIFKADELEYNMVLSVPEEIGLTLHKIIQGNGNEQDKNTQIEIIENKNESMDVEQSRKMM